VGIFVVKQIYKSEIKQMAESIENAEKLFGPELIVELKELDIRLSSANELLGSHMDFSQLFQSLQETTIPDVSFDAFDFKFEEGIPTVQMSGEAGKFSSIAIQSELYGDNDFLENHIFSDFSVTRSGTVAFKLAFQINSDKLLFRESFNTTPSVAPVEGDDIDSGDIINPPEGDLPPGDGETGDTELEGPSSDGTDTEAEDGGNDVDDSLQIRIINNEE